MLIVCLFLHSSQQQLVIELLEASCNGDVGYVIELLEKQTPVNWKNSDGRTPLHEACNNNRLEVVKVLLKHNPPINEQDRWGNTPLHIACWKGGLDCVKKLVATGQCDLG